MLKFVYIFCWILGTVLKLCAWILTVISILKLKKYRNLFQILGISLKTQAYCFYSISKTYKTNIYICMHTSNIRRSLWRHLHKYPWLILYRQKTNWHQQILMILESVCLVLKFWFKSVFLLNSIDHNWTW